MRTILTVIEELKIALEENKKCNQASQFIGRQKLEDGRIVNTKIVMEVINMEED